MCELIRAESLKLRATRSTGGLVAGLAVLEVLTVLLPLALAPLHGGRFALAGDFAQRTLACAGGTAAGLVAIVLGVLGMAGEYRHRTLTPTLLVTPDRTRLLAAKACVAAVAGGLLGAGAAAVSLAAVALGVPLRGAPLVLAGGDVAAIAVGGVLYPALAALLGLGIGAVVRDPVVAVSGILALFFVVETVLTAVAPGPARWLPGQAGSALAFPAGPAAEGGPLGGHVLDQATGGLTLAGYVAAVGVAALLVTRRRDIT
ncbi:hypothetical protein Dvina_11370 [Dactylosporangium vinaceum]|uniref:ABC transporter permease n=1 Tax=Dactylosporangium vinaceum TaxID=53362 RepID=A0ABV5MMW2_9ACTN|nr:hypothetical protein [Dactylosporangium vinaceum]UAB98627.1 hypothetical protein Dvina_11370 [Dactylosporangium vinaceum]